MRPIASPGTQLFMISLAWSTCEPPRGFYWRKAMVEQPDNFVMRRTMALGAAFGLSGGIISPAFTNSIIEQWPDVKAPAATGAQGGQSGSEVNSTVVARFWQAELRRSAPLRRDAAAGRKARDSRPGTKRARCSQPIWSSHSGRPFC